MGYNPRDRSSNPYKKVVDGEVVRMPTPDESVFEGFDGDAIKDAVGAILNMVKGSVGGGMVQLGAARTILEMQNYKLAWKQVRILSKAEVMQLLSYVAATGAGNRQMMGAIDRLIDLQGWKLGEHDALEDLMRDPADALADMLKRRDAHDEKIAKEAQARERESQLALAMMDEPEMLQ